MIDDARPVGGAQTYLTRLCAGTSAKGWWNGVVADELPAEQLPGVEQLRTSAPTRLATARLVLELEPDVVLLHTVDSPELARMLTKQVRTLVFAHDYRNISPGNLRFFQRSERFCERGFGLRCLVKPYTERCNNRRPDRVLESIARVRGWRSVLGEVDGVLCASERVAQLVRAFATEAAVSVVGYPIDVPDVPSPPASSRGGDVLYVGRTSPVKGIHHLVDAFARLAPTHPQSKLLVAGGPDLDSVHRRAVECGIGHAVELLGWLEPSALPAAYARARVLAMPSVWPEPYGMAGPEALAYGIPVVVSDVGGVRDWMDASFGALVPPSDPAALADALAALLDDAGAADAAGRAGHSFVSKSLTFDRHFERLAPLVAGVER